MGGGGGGSFLGLGAGAGVGAAIGSIVPGVGTAIGAAIGGGLGMGVGGSIDASNAMSGAANAQAAQAALTRNMAFQTAQPSFQEMQAIQSQLDMSHNLLTTQIQNLQQQKSLYEQTGGIASDLMNGKQSPVLQGLQYQSQLQRTQLENQLRDTLGPGYAASTAGSQALASFDAQQSAVMNNAQQQAIGQYLGFSGQLGGQLTQGYNQSYGLAGELNNQSIGAMQNNRALQVNAITGTANNLISTAGAPYVGQAYQANAMSQLGGTAMSLGLMSALKQTSGA